MKRIPKGEKQHIMGRDGTLFLRWSCHGSVESGMSPFSLFPVTCGLGVAIFQ